MENEWGLDHYLTSLIRYMCTATGLSESLVQGDHTPCPPESLILSSGITQYDQHYILSSKAVVFRDIHNCPEILNLITSVKSAHAAEIPEALRRERGHYLLFLERSQEKCVRNFALSESSVTLLEYFTVARSYHQYLRQFGTTNETLGELQSFFDELLCLGVLCVTNSDPIADKTIGSAMVL
jgi:hypothetical protein